MRMANKKNKIKNQKNWVSVTLKGLVLASAIRAGYDLKARDDGYPDLDGFEKFWEALEPVLYQWFREHPDKP